MSATTRRRAAVSKPLLITLVVAVLITGAYWTYRIATRETVEGDPNAAPTLYWVVCDECENRVKMTADEIRQLPDGPEGGMQCPGCKKYSARIERVRSPSVLLPEGG